jgi:hypothetical protein
MKKEAREEHVMMRGKTTWAGSGLEGRVFIEN